MNTDLYISILQDEFLQSIYYYKFERNKVIFLQDGTYPHMSPRVYDWLKEHNIGILN